MRTRFSTRPDTRNSSTSGMTRKEKIVRRTVPIAAAVALLSVGGAKVITTPESTTDFFPNVHLSNKSVVQVTSTLERDILSRLTNRRFGSEKRIVCATGEDRITNSQGLSQVASRVAEVIAGDPDNQSVVVPITRELVGSGNDIGNVVIIPKVCVQFNNGNGSGRAVPVS